MSTILLLGSSSAIRQKLLTDARIPFMVVEHTADEDAVTERSVLQDAVLAIAKLKMKHVVVPDSYDRTKPVYILTADTMGTDAQGVMHGKPKDREDAVRKLTACRGGVLTTSTGFCIEKRTFDENLGVWVAQDTHLEVVTAQCVFEVPDHWIDRYFENSGALVASGAVATEAYGYQFVKTITGSFSTINGLPMFEVRVALEKMGFFE